MYGMLYVDRLETGYKGISDDVIENKIETYRTSESFPCQKIFEVAIDVSDGHYFAYTFSCKTAVASNHDGRISVIYLLTWKKDSGNGYIHDPSRDKK